MTKSSKARGGDSGEVVSFLLDVGELDLERRDPFFDSGVEVVIGVFRKARRREEKAWILRL